MALLALFLLVANADAASVEAPAADTATDTATDATADPTAEATTEATAVATAEEAPVQEASEPARERSPVPFAIAGMTGALALGSGAAALAISASIAQSLEDAAAKRVPLSGYNARSAAFFACTGLAVTAGVTAIVATGAGFIFE